MDPLLPVTEKFKLKPFPTRSTQKKCEEVAEICLPIRKNIQNNPVLIELYQRKMLTLLLEHTSFPLKRDQPMYQQMLRFTPSVSVVNVETLFKHIQLLNTILHQTDWKWKQEIMSILRKLWFILVKNTNFLVCIFTKSSSVCVTSII